MDQWFAIDHSGYLLERQAGRLHVCCDEEIQGRQDMKGFLKLKGICRERMENSIQHHTHTHNVYI